MGTGPRRYCTPLLTWRARPPTLIRAGLPHYISTMCGRVTQRSGELPGLAAVMGDGNDSRIKDPKDLVRYNGVPSQDCSLIRCHPKSGEYQRDRLTWGLIPYWVKDATGGRKPINAKAETVPRCRRSGTPTGAGAACFRSTTSSNGGRTREPRRNSPTPSP